MYSRPVPTVVVCLAILLFACCAATRGSDHVAAATSATNARPVVMQARPQDMAGQGSSLLAGSDASIVEFSLGIGVLFTGIALFGLRGYRRQPGGYYVHPFRSR